MRTYDTLRQDLTQLHNTNPHFRLVGSLGRAVHHHAAYQDPTTEYRVRSEHPLDASRDIDAIGVTAVPQHSTFPVDTTALSNNRQAQLRANGNDWWLTSLEKSFSEQVHPDIVMPIEGITVGDIPTVTIPLQTHLALTYARGFMRKKDRLATTLLQQSAINSPHETLPDELYRPFNRLAHIQLPMHRIAMRAIYRSMPQSARNKFT